MDNLKVGDTFEYAIKNWRQLFHEPASPAIVLKVNVEPTLNRQYPACRRCLACNVIVSQFFSSISSGHIQILVGNKKFVIAQSSYSSSAITFSCPESKQDE